MLTVLLQRAGHEVELAGNGLEVLELFEKRPFDVILMDVQMPEMDGDSAVRGDEQTVEPGLEDAADVAGEVQQHRQFGPQLGDGGERSARVVVEEDARNNRQVTRRRNGQEFGQSLHHRQNGYLQPRHRRRLNHDDDRTVGLLLTRCAYHRLCGGHRVPTAADTLRWSNRSTSVSLRLAAATTSSSACWDLPRYLRAVDLDDKHLLFDVERKAATIPYLAKPARV